MQRLLICLLISISLHANCYQTFKQFLIENKAEFKEIDVNQRTYALYKSKGITYVYNDLKLAFRVETELSEKAIRYLIESGIEIFKVYKKGDKVIVETNSSRKPTQKYILMGVSHEM